MVGFRYIIVNTLHTVENKGGGGGAAAADMMMMIMGQFVAIISL